MKESLHEYRKINRIPIAKNQIPQKSLELRQIAPERNQINSDFLAGYYNFCRQKFPEIHKRYRRIPVAQDGKLLTPDKSRNIDIPLQKRKLDQMKRIRALSHLNMPRDAEFKPLKVMILQKSTDLSVYRKTPQKEVSNFRKNLSSRLPELPKLPQNSCQSADLTLSIEMADQFHNHIDLLTSRDQDHWKKMGSRAKRRNRNWMVVEF